MTRVFIWKNNSPQEWEEISFSAFSKARRNGCFTGRFLLKQSKCSVMKMTALSWNVLAKILKNTNRRTATAAISRNMRKVALYSRLLMWEIVTAQRKVIRIQICLWDESVDTAEQAIQNLLLEDLHQALLKLSPAERDFILSYYEMKIPNATCLAQRYGITRQAADKRLKKIEEKIKKLVAIF